MSLEKDVLIPINSKEKYDRGNFTKAYGKVLDIGGYLQTLEKDPYNDSATMDLGQTLTGDQKYFLKTKKDETGKDTGIPLFSSVTQIRGFGKRAHSSCLDNIANYVETNIDQFFSLIEDKSLLNLIHSVPLYKTGKKEHDDVVQAIKEMRETEEIAKDPEKREMYVREKLEKMPKWFQEATYLFTGDRRAISSLFDDMSVSVKKNYQNALLDEEGNVKVTKIREIIKNSLKEAREHYDKETNEEDKKDIWEADIRPYYRALANEAYPSEKKKNKQVSDPSKESRKEERKKIGMSQ